MQDSFIDFDYSQKANNYCPDDYDPSKEIIDKFKDSTKMIEDFKSNILILQGYKNINSFYYALLCAIQYHLKTRKMSVEMMMN